MAKKKQTFEESLGKLETIVRDIEEGKIGLEESIKRYEEGMGLLSHCRKILSQAELRLQTLQEGSEGELEAKPSK